MTDILPCPFCGSTPVVRRCVEEYPPDNSGPVSHPGGEYELSVTIHCTSCGTEMTEEYRSEVIEAWNKRPTLTQPERRE